MIPPKRRHSLAFVLSQIAQWSRIRLQCRRPRFDSWVGKFPWRRDRLPSPVFLGFPGGSSGKESACNAGNLGLIPGLGRSSGEGKGHPLQYSGLENSTNSPWGCKESDTTKQLSLHLRVWECLALVSDLCHMRPHSCSQTTGLTVKKKKKKKVKKKKRQMHGAPYVLTLF